MIHGQANIK